MTKNSNTKKDAVKDAIEELQKALTAAKKELSSGDKMTDPVSACGWKLSLAIVEYNGELALEK